MAFSKIGITLVLLFAAFNATTIFPLVKDVLANVFNILRTWMPTVIELLEDIAYRVHRYCSERLVEDLKRVFLIMGDFARNVFALLQPAAKSLFDVVADGLVALHNNGMGYTDDILQQVLGIEAKALPDQVGTARNKLLSLILFLFWIIMGLVCISRMSYNKFFLLMSGTFLIHAFFGPLWCVRRLAFFIGVSLWLGSLISSKPIPAAFAVLVAFALTGFRKWRKKAAMIANTNDLLKFNQTLEQRLDGMEKKLDLLITRLNSVNVNPS